MVAAALGPCYAGHANIAGLCDFVTMNEKTASIGVGGTHLVRASLSLDITPLAVALVFLLDNLLNPTAFAVLLYTMIVALSFLHVAPFRMHKMGGRWYYVITVYVLVMTVVYASIL